VISAQAAIEPQLRGGPEPQLSNFTFSTDVFAQASRRAGRLNASAISDHEVQNLLHERQHLLDKKFDGTLTQAEAIRLQYVRWSLDRIEDARDGEVLDAIESWVAQYEHFQADLQVLQRELNSRKKGRRR
jgi:hypothetical protein